MLVSVMVFAFVLLLIGVNFGLRSDVQSLAQQSVDAGSSALQGAIDARTEQVRSAILQGSAQSALANALKTGNRAALASAASDIAVSSNLSFVVVTDTKGNILAGSRAASGSMAKDGIVSGAASGAVAGGSQVLDGGELHALGVTTQAPALAIAMASPVNVGGTAVGVLYGGTVVDATTKFVDDVSRVTGGATGIALSGKFAATSLATKEGVKEVGTGIQHVDVSDRKPFSAAETLDGTQYYARTAPLLSYDGKIIGETWFGVPYAQFVAIVNNTVRQILFWGVIGLVIASIVGTLVASRIGRAISLRSDEVNESAKQLRVLVVGGEVSGDHVSQTRETLEEIKDLAQQAADTTQLQVLAGRALDDVVVIDTLTSELSSRMRDAAVSVERLTTVAEELDALVAGARPSKN
jgi:hypothetical protein